MLKSISFSQYIYINEYFIDQFIKMSFLYMFFYF